MSLQRVMPWLIALLLTTVSGMVLAARDGLTVAAVAFAAAFTFVIAVVSVRTNLAYWRPQAEPAFTFLDAARRNARLNVLVFAWGALAMQALYFTPLTGLRWQHGWQYALAFALLAVSAFLYVHLGGSNSAATRERLVRLATPLAAVQALVAAGGLVFLLGSDKLQTQKADWAANIVFLFSALAILIVSTVALRTQTVLPRTPR
jgi:hypothetical protein